MLEYTERLYKELYQNYEEFKEADVMLQETILTYSEEAELRGIEKGNDVVKSALEHSGPVICEVFADAECLASPRTATRVMPDGGMRSSPLENQFPFLPDEEAQENMMA